MKAWGLYGKQILIYGGTALASTLYSSLLNPQDIIQFGETENQIYHTFRHIDALGIDRSVVESSIESHLRSVSSQIVEGQPFNQIIEVSGQQIQYTAFKLPNGIINVGRIHGVN